MRVKLLVSIASPDWAYAPGQEAEIDGTTAAAWIESGIAEAVRCSAPESTMTGAPESAVLPAARKRARA